MKKILLVEDDQYVGMMVPEFLDLLGGSYKLLVAETHEQAMEMVIQNPDISLVFMDGNLNPNVKQLDTLDLVGFVKINCPNAVLVATSSNAEWSQTLLVQGCDCSMPKSSLASLDGLGNILKMIKPAIAA